MSLLIATPVILPPREDVLASWDHRPHDIVVNGADDEWDGVFRRHLGFSWYRIQKNLGVARSWNYAFLVAQAERADYVALLSQNCVLARGTSHLARLVEEHADWRGLLTDQAFHCIVISVALWEKVGPFDERFHSYYEDADWLHRCELLGYHTAADPIPKVEIACECENAATMRAGLFTAEQYAESGRMYETIWGGPPNHETRTLEDRQ